MLLALGLFAGAHLQCSTQYALLMKVTATSLVETFDLRVKNLETGEVVLERAGEPVDPSEPNRDISKPGEQIKVSIEFAQPGNFLVHMIGRAGQGSTNLQFHLKDYQVDDVREVSVRLEPLQNDGDGDGFPACGSDVNCGTVGCDFLDCDDADPQVNPFGTEVCGNGKDDDCSARCAADPSEGDELCVDNDGDGVPTPKDCDDNDPCRAPGLGEAPNLCAGEGGGLPALPQACLDKLAKEGKSPNPPFCGDGVDQDCNGQDVACRTDEDCDSYSPPADCDDKDAKVNPGVPEDCKDEIDNNCDGTINEGCVPCDVDGDGHALPEVTAADCTDDKGDPLPKDDSDDFDSGVFPRATAETDGKEGGTVELALREYCSATKLDKDGKRPQREVDHDGDGKAAKDDGCPTLACDADGDGFANASCNPPKSLEDCNDADPRIFPGAPDRCGDGIPQNCAADTPCAQVTDRDGDGWADGVDCLDDPSNDGDPNKPKAASVGPWAVEVCDGFDNDCDGLVDEGNPGADGKPIDTIVGRCNDNNEGQCGGGGPSSNQACMPNSPGCSAAGRVLSGKCACSRIEPKGARAEGNRVQCGGEDLGALASPRCFGATQPVVERCDDKDWDCNGKKDDPTGANPLVDKGKPCGTNIGNCKAGTVVGCDLSQSLPGITLIEKVLKAQSREFNRHWVCKLADGGDVWHPTTERCNGKDDDCDDVLPSDEKDGDTDKHIACSGCTKGTGRFDLAGGLDGCGDCNNNAAAIFPGAPELCNDIDDNCADGKGDDGKDECTGGTSCCSAQKACKNLQTDTFNCGGCGTICPASTSDSCVSGSCACGGATPCGPGLDCQGGSCQCIQGGRCSGCCSGNSCRAGNTVSLCGTNGESCDNCSDGNECTSDVCSGGNCSNPNEPRTTQCNSNAGNCYNGSCCTGCVGASQCQSGASVQYCGLGGGDCSSCTAGECRAPVCSGSGSCATTPADEGNSCSGNPSAGADCLAGQCQSGSCADVPTNQGGDCDSSSGKCADNGSCCKGCLTGGGSCNSGTSTSSCGTGGELCDDCTLKAETCSGGNCVCGGCYDGGLCYADGATNELHCGTGGGACTACNTGETCSGGSCGCAGCYQSGTCYPGTADNRCGTGGGTCTNCSTVGSSCSGGSCDCAGCINGSSLCVSGTDPDECGTGGGACTSCPSGTECQTRTCSGSCGLITASDGTACGSGGQCRSGTCCDSGCWNGSSCVSGQSDPTACIDSQSTGSVCRDCDSYLGTSGATCETGVCVAP